MKNIFPILILAAVLRLWNLGGVPPAASMDEASIGYNAYSVTKIGIDEFGQFPLISQRGYDDWRRSTYLFLTTPFIALFGLHPVSIRMPAVILSVLTVWAVYTIVLLLFKKRSTYAVYTAVVTSFLLAISSWHIYLSRIGHETNAYMAFGIFGLLFFLQGIKNKSRFLLSMICFTLSIISYYAGQVFIPLFGVGLIVLYRNTLRASLRPVFILVAILCILIVSTTFFGSAIVRFGGTSTFKPEAHYQEYTKRMERWNKAVVQGNTLGRIRNSKYLFPVEVFVQSYISHFNSSWLFMNSFAEPFKVPHLGLLYVWQLPFILIGIIVFLFHRDLDTRAKKSIILWFLLSPIPGSIATGAPHAMRTIPSVFTWELFTAFGVLYTVFQLKKFAVPGVLIMAVFVISGLFSFFHNYFVVFPKEQSGSFNWALSRAVPYVLANEHTFDKVIFSNEDNLYQSYMLFLYYAKYDPLLYQKQGGTHSGGYAETHTFGKYEFRPIKKEERLLPNVLYVGNTADFALSVAPVAQFANLDGKIVIEAVSQ